MTLTVILFLIGFIILLKGADWLVEGAGSIAKRINISNLVIGLTLVAFGTSMPELIVNILASINGSTDIAIGNILGSNIANILLILGVAGAIYPLKVTNNTVWKEIPLAILAVIAVAVMSNDRFFAQRNFSEIDRGDGLMLIFFFIIFLYYIYSLTRSSPSNQNANIKVHSVSKSLLMSASGLLALVIGGKWVVEGAMAIAQTIGVSESLIGLTVVAVGTSLPELATSAVAAHKHNADIAVGNVVGSNIFNIFWILGLSAIIKPLTLKPANNFDITVAIIATLLLFATMFIGKRQLLERWQGIGFVAIYVAYIAFLVVRG